MIIYAIRHPEPLGAEGICYGQSDLDVSPETLKMTTAYVKSLLPDQPIDLWLSSPLQRASKLAAELTDSFAIDDRLLEMDFGDWEGLRWEKIERESFDAWATDYMNVSAPGGESYGAVVDRVENLLADLQAAGHGTVALVTHAGAIRALLTHILGIPIESCWRFNVGFGALVVLKTGQSNWENQLLTLTVAATPL
jgi:alpha-ribazole phosphatase